MAYDPERFARAYLPGPLPRPFADRWTLAAIERDRVRAAVDVRLERDDGARLVVFVERRVEGGRCFAQTARVQVSYYAEGAIDDAEAASILAPLVAQLRAIEATLDAGELDAALAIDVPREARRRALELRINRDCNEACVFCNTPASSDTILPSAAAIHEAIERERAAGYDELTLTGRETTLDPELPAYVRSAREAGYRRVRVQTNGTSFAEGPLLDRLIDAGMTCAEISLHTLAPETFRRLVAAPPRLLEKTLAGLARLAERPSVECHLVVAMTRLNAAQVPTVIARARAIHPGLVSVTVSPMAPVGDGAAALDLVPRPDELREPFGAIAELAAQHGLLVRVPSRCGAPLCAFPPGAAGMSAELDNPPGQTLEPGKSKAPECARCVAEPRCTGVWSAALARWGPGALRPITTLPTRATRTLRS